MFSSLFLKTRLKLTFRIKIKIVLFKISFSKHFWNALWFLPKSHTKSHTTKTRLKLGFLKRDISNYNQTSRVQKKISPYATNVFYGNRTWGLDFLSEGSQCVKWSPIHILVRLEYINFIIYVVPTNLSVFNFYSIGLKKNRFKFFSNFYFQTYFNLVDKSLKE